MGQVVPLLVFEGFVETLNGKSLVDICCGTGRELRLVNKYDVNVAVTDLTVEHLDALVKQDILAGGAGGYRPCPRECG